MEEERTILTFREKVETVILNIGLACLFFSFLFFISPFIPVVMPGFDVWLSETYNRPITFDINPWWTGILFVAGLLMVCPIVYSAYMDEKSRH